MICPTCGNPVPSAQSRCVFCGGSLAGARPAKQGRKAAAGGVRVLNLEQGMPTVAEAREKLHRELAEARRSGVRAVKLIHGYGSTGSGGVLRGKLRGSLRNLEKKGEIVMWLAGEEFHRGDAPGRRFLARYPELDQDSDYQRGNRGITLVGLQ